MTDSEFRLTPIDVRSQEFRRMLRGYDPAEVEDFRERVAQEIERILREKLQLDERITAMREQLKALREREKAINDALVTAQELRADTQDSAKKEAELIVREARAEADQIIAEARKVELAVRDGVEDAQIQFSSYLASFRQLLERQLAQVDALEAFERNGEPPKLEETEEE